MRPERNFSLVAFRTLRPALRRSAVAAFIAITLTAGFVLVRGRAAAIGLGLPESFTKIFASRRASTLSAPAPVPFAADQFWNTNGTSSTWTASNWGTSAAGPFTTAWTNTNNANFTANSLITFVTNTQVGNVVVTNGSTVTMTAAGTYSTNGAIRTLDVGTGSILDFSSQGISSAAGTGLVKDGGGIYFSSNATSSSMPGGFTLQNGTIILGATNSMGTGPLTINGGTLAANASRTFTSKFTSFTIGGDFTMGAVTTGVTSGNGSSSANISIDTNASLGAATRTITIGANGTYTLGGIISGNAGTGLTVANSGGATGNLTLTNANTYSGATTVSGGTLKLNRSGGTTIPTTNNVTVSGGTLEISTNQTITDFTMTTGTLLIDSGVTLTITGTYSASGGTINNQGTIKLNNTSASFPGTGVTVNNGTANTLTNLEVASGTTTLTANISVAGTLTVSGGTLDLSTFTADRSISGGTLTIANGATLKIGGTNTLPANYSTHSIGSTSTINYSGTTQSVATLNSSQSYGNLTISGSGTKTLAGNIVVAGTLTLSAGTLAVSNKILELDGDTSVASGTLDASAGTVDYFQSTSGQHVIAADCFLLAFNNQNKILPSGTIGILDTFTPGTATGHTITGSTFDFKKTSGSETIPAFNYYNLTSSGGTNARTLASSGVIGIANVFTPGNDVYTVTGSTIEYNGTSAQTMPSSRGFNYNNLSINNSANVTAPDLTGQTASIASTLFLKSGTFTLNTGNGVTLANGATINRSGGSISAAPTFGTSVNVIYSGSSSTTTGPEIPTSTSVLNNLTINDSAGVILGANAQVNGTLTFTSGLVTTGANTLTLGSSATTSGAGTSTYVVGNLKKLSVPSSFTFDVGDAGYSPVAFSSVVGTGDVTVKAVHDFRISGTAQALQRYWTLTNSGGITSTNLQFQYLSGDVHGNEAIYIAYKIDGATITHPAAVINTTNHTATLVAQTSFSDWTFAEPTAPTAVNLINFNATRNGNDVLLQWRSGYEVRNLGYNIYREQNGVRTLITPSLVAGSALVAGRQTELTAGQSYAWYDEIKDQRSEVRDQNAQIGNQQSGITYWLEDVDLNGTRTLHGPVAVTQGGEQGAKGETRSPMLGEQVSGMRGSGVLFDAWPAGETAESRGQRSELRDQKTEGRNQKAEVGSQRSETANQVSVQSLADQQTIAATPGVKLSISKAGWYRITQPDLMAAGLDPNANVAHLQLFANAQEVPIRISANGAQLTSSDYVEFYGHGVDSTTDTEQTYYLIVGTTNGKRIARVSDSDLPAPSGPASFEYIVERKERSIYFSGLLNGDAENFFGRIIKPAAISATIPATHLNQPSGSNAQLEVQLQGVTTGAHSVHVVINGTDLGTMSFANTDHPTQTFNVPAATLVEGDNTVQLSALGRSSDVSLIDTLRLTYGHTFAAENNRLAITVNGPGVTRVGGFASANVRAMDVSDPSNVQELTPTVSQQPDGTYSADMRVGGASVLQPHTLFVFADSAAANADAIKHNYPSTWSASSNTADYLIITTRDLMSSVQPLANLRTSKGMIVNTIDVDDIYDEYSFGLHTPYAIRDFLRNAATNWPKPPRFVLFVGDSTYDPKNYFGVGANDLVPTKLIDTVQLETASDDWLADFDNDGIADLAIGRLPARTTANVTNMLTKIINFENAPADPSRGALLVADRTFESASTAVQTVLPGSLPVQTINRSATSDDATAHNQILSALNQGPRIANYFGHGSNGVWTSAPLLSSLDAPSLTNSDHLSMFTMMTCFNGYFEDAINDSLSEALLKSNAGAVAVWASTGLTEPSGQNAISQQFYSRVFTSQPRLGDAVRAAKQASGDPDVRRTWTLFGDPAMSLASITPTVTTGDVGGIITDAGGHALAGVTINLHGMQSRTTITDANGRYAFGNAEMNGFYTVTPAFPNYSFNPPSQPLSLLGPHAEASFVGSPNGGSINPLDTDQFFVRQHYLDFLNREPDEDGFNFWTNQITSCGSDVGCREVRRINTSASYFLSIEYQETGFETYRLYKSAFGNMDGTPVPLRFSEFMADARTIGQGVVVNQTGWQTALENNKRSFSEAFVQRARFVSAYPATMTPAEFVDSLFAHGGVTPSAEERSAAINEFGGALQTTDNVARARALRRVAENATLARQEFNRAFVLMEYFGYLRRDPNSGPDTDFSGYNFWLDKLNRFSGNFIDAEMVKAFLSSTEYRRRFAP